VAGHRRPAGSPAAISRRRTDADPRLAAIDMTRNRRSPGFRAAVLAWAASFGALEAFAAAVLDARRRLRALQRDDAALVLATAHATKGLEFDHVAVLMDAGRFPSARSLTDASDPDAALEEERRLAYVAGPARRSLTLATTRPAVTIPGRGVRPDEVLPDSIS
jgi:superfamily I DNA/RNA helicase